MCKVSIVENHYTDKTVDTDITVVYDRIRTGGKTKSIIQDLRNGKDVKNSLPAVMFSGIFKGRKDSDLIKHSGRAILDFDKVESPQEWKDDLKQYPFIEAIFLSPSGNGVKAVARIDGENHGKVYDAMMQELAYLNPDTSNRNLARLCYVSYDPDIHINENAEVFDKILAQSMPPVGEQMPHDDNQVDRVISTARKMIQDAPDGTKHTTLLKASYLLGGAISHGLTYDSAFDILLNEISNRDIECLDSAEKAIRKALSKGIEKPLQFERKLKMVDKPKQKHIEVEQTGGHFKPITEYFDEYAKAKIPDKNPLTLGIPQFDERMKNKYRGKLCAFIGYGGTKKSLFALNVANANAMRSKRIMYAQMEMGIEDQMDRFVNIALGDSTSQLSQDFDEMEKKEQGAVKEYLSFYKGQDDSNRFLLSQTPSLQAADFAESINEIIETYGKVDALFIDGLSMMGGDMHEQETPRYSRHTKELKEIANTYGIFIGLICHVSRGLTKHAREVSRYVRGSEKILDNIDFVLNFSLVADEYGEEPIYKSDKGWIRLWDKRGGGGVHDVIYDFDWKTMKMTQAIDDPSVWVDTSKKRNYGF